MDKKNLAKQKINNITIFNLIKSLGIKTSTTGMKYILSVILIGYSSYDDIMNFEKIYRKIAKKYNVSPSTVRNAIQNSLNHRNYKLAEKNFESIFGYEYNEYTFINKEFFEEILRVISIES